MHLRRRKGSWGKWARCYRGQMGGSKLWWERKGVKLKSRRKMTFDWCTEGLRCGRQGAKHFTWNTAFNPHNRVPPWPLSLIPILQMRKVRLTWGRGPGCSHTGWIQTGSPVCPSEGKHLTSWGRRKEALGQHRPIETGHKPQMRATCVF